MLPLKTICIIIGSMKSGTSMLFDLLSRHPEVCASAVKEPYFFASEQKYRRGHQAYFDLWDPRPAHTVALEGSTDYTKFPYVRGVPQRIKELEDSGYVLKFLYVMRHPVRRVESHLKHLYLHRCDVIEIPTPLASPDAGLLDRCISFSSYAYQLEQFASIFDRSQISLISFERLVADRRATLEAAFSFLGLPDCVLAAPEEEMEVNASEKVRTWENLPGYYRAASDLRMARLVSPFLPESLKARIRSTVAPSYPYRTRLTAEEETIVIERLKPDLVQLRDRWGFDVAAEWNLL